MKMGRLQRLYVNSSLRSDEKREAIGSLLSDSELARMHNALEIGSGCGITCAALNSKYGLEVVGADIDPKEVEIASRRFGNQPGLRFVLADATDLPFRDGEFDLAAALMVLHHIKEWPRALEEIDRVLAPNGIFVALDLTYSELLKKLFKPALRSHGVYSVRDIVDFLQGRGFEVVDQLQPESFYLNQFHKFTIAFRKT
jgi:ubiquinone/menaquinone biosynthesis C-methylase UbiE